MMVFAKTPCIQTEGHLRDSIVHSARDTSAQFDDPNLVSCAGLVPVMRLAHDLAVHQAMHDPLTGLPNRRAADHHLDAIASVHLGEPAALAMIDLDGFNDRLGHNVGDAVLRAIAALPAAHGVTASIGLADLPSGTDSAATLARADAAMYQAKKFGGNTVVVADDPTGSGPVAGRTCPSHVSATAAEVGSAGRRTSCGS